MQLLVLAVTTPAQGQLLPTDTTESTPATVPSWPEDSLGRRTPRGAVEGFIQAVATENYRAATGYLSLNPRLPDARDGEEYADRLAVQINHLNKILKEVTGRTTTELISERIAQEAQVLLKKTSWTIAQIADSLGFTDAAHFSHFFKRQTLRSPAAFRAEG
jgi:AraC-like DNA-binding protein